MHFPSGLPMDGLRLKIHAAGETENQLLVSEGLGANSTTFKEHLLSVPERKSVMDLIRRFVAEKGVFDADILDEKE